MGSVGVQENTDGLYKRKPGRRHKQQQDSTVEEDIDDIKEKMNMRTGGVSTLKKHRVASIAVTVMSFFTTFYMIWYPAQVVFDEVHFGKFAGYYLQGVYFFDVHPPLAKLMLSAVGYLIGFNGVYKFSNIGENYSDHHVPYIPLRALPACMNVMGVYLVYNIMQESGFSVLTCFLTCTLYLLDNAFIAQSRLILLDSILVFYMLTSIYSYIRFRKLRHVPFTKPWWTWLCATGACMGLTLSVKLVGLFVFAGIGIAVVADLWDLIDIKHGLKKSRIAKHIGARAGGLLLVPAVIYLFWFYIHFAILTASGPGDSYMSLKFQNTLTDSPFTVNSLEIMFNQSIRLQNKETLAFLHSHEYNYPAQYEDGRFSARGQQVVGNRNPDFGSYWRLLPADDLANFNQPIRHNDIIRLEHILTGSKLLTHNVASPYTPTNQEVTTTRDESKYNETLFRVILEDLSGGTTWSTIIKGVNLVHVDTGVGLMVNPKPLPNWGLFHFEVNGQKKTMHPSNFWTATDILGIDPVKINTGKKRKVTKMSFFRKFWELQNSMIRENNKLTLVHPYQSKPSSWPLMTRGISYWSDAATSRQIYLTGNVNGWWGGLACIFMYGAINLFDMILKKRGTKLFRPTLRVRFHRTGGFFLLLWSTHYFPFFLMGRSLYLHHYLPAMACNYLLIGCVFDYFFIKGVNSPISYQPPYKKHSFDRAKATLKSYLAASIMIGMQFIVYLFLSPTTYGTTSLSEEEATRHKVLKSWDLQFAKPVPIQ